MAIVLLRYVLRTCAERIMPTEYFYTPNDPCGDVPTVVAARTRLDGSISGFNRHARLADNYRRACERFERARDAHDALRTAVEQTQAAAVAAQRQAGLELLRSARQCVDIHRSGIQLAVRSYVQSLRAEGLPPERALVAVKHRLAHAVTDAKPDAPRFDASRLAEDVSAWAIAAFFDAA